MQIMLKLAEPAPLGREVIFIRKSKSCCLIKMQMAFFIRDIIKIMVGLKNGILY